MAKPECLSLESKMVLVFWLVVGTVTSVGKIHF